MVGFPAASMSARPDVRAAPVALFQLGWGTTPALSAAPIGTVLLPTKLTPIARTGAVVIRSGADRTVPPLVPATVMAYVPSATSGGTETTIDEVPAPVIDDGAKEMVVPGGWPDALSATPCAKSPTALTVTVNVPDCPGAIARADGLTTRLKSATGAGRRPYTATAPS